MRRGLREKQGSPTKEPPEFHLWPMGKGRQRGKVIWKKVMHRAVRSPALGAPPPHWCPQPAGSSRPSGASEANHTMGLLGAGHTQPSTQCQAGHTTPGTGATTMAKITPWKTPQVDIRGPTAPDPKTWGHVSGTHTGHKTQTTHLWPPARHIGLDLHTNHVLSNSAKRATQAHNSGHTKPGTQ